MNPIQAMFRLSCLNILVVVFMSFSLPIQANQLQEKIKIKVLKDRGNAYYQPRDSSTWEPIDPEYNGTYGDGTKILMDKGSRLILFCSNQERTLEWKPRPFLLSNECTFLSPKLGAEAICAGKITKTVPSVISPRYTLIDEIMPTIRWYAVDDAIAYKIILYKDNGMKDTNLSKLIYSTQDRKLTIAEDKLTGIKTVTLVDLTEQPKLEVSGNYRLEIKAILKNGSIVSSQEDIQNADRFLNQCFPPKNGISKLRFQLQKDEQNPGSKYEDLKNGNYLAMRYFNQAFHAKAIDIMSNLLKEDQRPAIFISLGDYYQQIYLYRSACGAYKRAIIRAKELAQDGYGKQAQSKFNELCGETS
jgi:hypothetical protein